jgi:hypothetical protein
MTTNVAGLPINKTKITIGQVEPLLIACSAVLNSQQPVVFKARIALRNIIAELAPHGKNLDEEKEKLIQELALKDESGKPQQDKAGNILFGDNKKEADNRWKEINSTALELTHQLTMAAVENVEGGPEIDPLAWLVMEDEEPKPPSVPAAEQEPPSAPAAE